MEWLTAIRKSIDYIEEHLNDNISAQDVAEQVYVSPLHFQRGFLIMTGYSISEYIRNRKLYMAALELKKANRKVIDVAFDYGYDTPDSFTKAFTRFHGISPVQVKQGGDIRTFLPLSVKITVQVQLINVNSKMRKNLFYFLTKKGRTFPLVKISFFERY